MMVLSVQETGMTVLCVLSIRAYSSMTIDWLCLGPRREIKFSFMCVRVFLRSER